MNNEFKDMELGIYVKPFDLRSYFKFGISFSPALPFFELKIGPLHFEIGWMNDESIQELSASNQRDQA
jgi:hypothetical protein